MASSRRLNLACNNSSLGFPRPPADRRSSAPMLLQRRCNRRLRLLDRSILLQPSVSNSRRSNVSRRMPGEGFGHA
ncbi:hypothetical protein HPP92_005696 [Vanilla planifolia]|uniref:Uncharacterized protein n=1 Tax=Vanilla planifolia TaxID=51239 RepID=A0A835S031_VANPL|nr:hypothetical protein HPP92_005696 [Vanilla planifolia]